jgi:hypothetical protein
MGSNTGDLIACRRTDFRAIARAALFPSAEMSKGQCGQMVDCPDDGL